MPMRHRGFAQFFYKGKEMNILQSLKLGHKLTMIHKKSSAVFSIFFGLLFSSVVLLSNTINNEYTQTSSAFKDATNGKYLAKRLETIFK